MKRKRDNPNPLTGISLDGQDSPTEPRNLLHQLNAINRPPPGPALASRLTNPPAFSITGSPLKKFLKNTLPWLFCILIFVYLFMKIPLHEFKRALAIVNIPLFIALALGYFLIMHIMDCFTYRHFMTRFSAPITFRECWLVRGVSYPIMILNYHAAQVAFAIYLKKNHKASIAKTLGTLAFVSIMDFILVLTTALIALGFTDTSYRGFDIRSFVFKFAPLVYAGYGLWILFWKNVDKPFVARWQRFRVVNWVLKHNIFLVFRRARAGDFLQAVLYRIPMIVTALGGFQLGLTAFGAFVDWIPLYLYNAIIMFISSLPITPAGLGTGQFLSIEFFRDLVQNPLVETGVIQAGALLFAVSLLWGLANQIIKMIFGMICLTRTPKELFVKNSGATPRPRELETS